MDGLDLSTRHARAAVRIQRRFRASQRSHTAKRLLAVLRLLRDEAECPRLHRFVVALDNETDGTDQAHDGDIVAAAPLLRYMAEFMFEGVFRVQERNYMQESQAGVRRLHTAVVGAGDVDPIHQTVQARLPACSSGVAGAEADRPFTASNVSMQDFDELLGTDGAEALRRMAAGLCHSAVILARTCSMRQSLLWQVVARWGGGDGTDKVRSATPPAWHTHICGSGDNNTEEVPDTVNARDWDAEWFSHLDQDGLEAPAPGPLPVAPPVHHATHPLYDLPVGSSTALPHPAPRAAAPETCDDDASWTVDQEEPISAMYCTVITAGLSEQRNCRVCVVCELADDDDDQQEEGDEEGAGVRGATSARTGESTSPDLDRAAPCHACGNFVHAYCAFQPRAPLVDGSPAHGGTGVVATVDHLHRRDPESGHFCSSACHRVGGGR